MPGTIVTDLVPPVDYVAGNELTFKIVITAPEDGTYYVLGALYDIDLDYISDSLFGVLLLGETTDSYVSPVRVTTYGLSKDEELEINCRFILSRSSIVMGLFLVRMVGEEASLDDDIEEASISIMLAGPVPPEPINLNSVANAIVAVGMIGMMMETAG